MKVPPLVINLKNIEKSKKHKKHKKHKRHHKRKHQHQLLQQQHADPPVLEYKPQCQEDLPVVETFAPVKEDLHVAEVCIPVKEDPPPVLEPNSPKSPKISFLHKADDGSVTLAIIGPKYTKEDSNERVLNLEQLCNQLSEGMDVIPPDLDKEESLKALQVKPVDFVETNTFGTYLPIQDSTFANLTREDTETLLEIYGGNEICYEYAKNLQEYAKGTNYLMTMVDSLLDLLTDGKHRKEAIPIREKLSDQQEQQKEKEKENKKEEDKKEDEEREKEDDKEESKKKEEELEPEKEKEKEQLDEVQQQLDAIDNLIQELKEIQEKRLSASAAPIEPGEEESRLADEILTKMTKLIKEKAKPGELCNSASIFKALGIPLMQ